MSDIIIGQGGESKLPAWSIARLSFLIMGGPFIFKRIMEGSARHEDAPRDTATSKMCADLNENEQTLGSRREDVRGLTRHEVNRWTLNAESKSALQKVSIILLGYPSNPNCYGLVVLPCVVACYAASTLR